MIIAMYITILFIIIFLIGKINLSYQFNKEVKQLFSQSKNISGKTFRYSQLTGLPEPVQHYFKHVLKEGQSYISYARLKHDGQFKTGLDKKWINIKGEQYFTAYNPGFIWKGVTSMFTARDMYIAGKGRLIVTLLSIINAINAQEEIFNEAEFQRWIAESVWFPTNLLPSERLTWSAIDTSTAKLNFRYGELSIFFLVTFNEAGEIIQMETTRFMDKDKKETWLCKMTDYKEVDKILIPSNAEAIWKLATGNYSYARFGIKKIEYNNPALF